MVTRALSPRRDSRALSLSPAKIGLQVPRSSLMASFHALLYMYFKLPSCKIAAVCGLICILHVLPRVLANWKRLPGKRVGSTRRVYSVSAKNRSLVREFFHFATPFVVLIDAARPVCIFFSNDVKCKNNKPAAANTLSCRKLFTVSSTNCFPDCKNVSAPFFWRVLPPAATC